MRAEIDLPVWVRWVLAWLPVVLFCVAGYALLMSPVFDGIAQTRNEVAQTRLLLKNYQRAVGGGGATDAEISQLRSELARTFSGIRATTPNAASNALQSAVRAIAGRHGIVIEQMRPGASSTDGQSGRVTLALDGRANADQLGRTFFDLENHEEFAIRIVDANVSVLRSAAHSDEQQPDTQIRLRLETEFLLQ